jgi:hypothetical protein
MNKLKSRKFWLTLLAHAGSAYLASKGHTAEAATLSAIAQGTYNIGQGMADGATAKDAIINAAVETALQKFGAAKAGK